MLSPADRSVLTEALRPPAGYEVDRVIATTYSLDLVTLLTIPLSFTLLSGDGINDNGRIDPIALLEALRRHANQITVFCDAGHIAAPQRGQLLFGYLEKSVVEATAPRGGAFHPKVTVVRYRPNPKDPAWQDAECPDKDSAWYRLFCGTRNLTFDRSWDTMLVLEGALASGRKNAIARNRPLSRFIGALPGMAVHELDDSRRAQVEQVADELLRVAFEPPPGFGTERDDLAFWPIGLDEQSRWPFVQAKGRMLVVSPFVDRACLDRLRAETVLAAVVGRPEELDRLPTGTLDEVEEVFVLADAAEAEQPPGGDLSTEQPASETDDSQVLAAESSGVGLSGLHAKLFIADAGWRSTVWTGSANATSAAFSRNVEFLVELRGKKSVVGIDALLGKAEGDKATGREVTFRGMLSPYQPPAKPAPVDTLQRRLEERCDTVRQTMVAAALTATVSACEPPAPSFEIAVRATVPGAAAMPPGVSCAILPVTRLHDQPVTIASLEGEVASISRLAMESLTSFFVVNLEAHEADRSFTLRFVLNIPLIGAPDNRENKLLLAMLSNRERLIRYLLMLLAGPELAIGEMQRAGSIGDGEDAYAPGGFGLPLLEPLLRTLANDSARLADIERLVRDLESTEEGTKLLPSDFRQVWDAIIAVRGASRKAEDHAAL